VSGSPEQAASSVSAGSREPAAASAGTPLVSVVVRTRNRPVLLVRALATIAAQTYRPIEAIVVNDGGGELDVAGLRAALGDVPLVYERLEASGGRAHAANTGVAAARGVLIAFLDDDDELLPGHLSTLVAALAATGADVVYSDCEIVDRELDADGRIVRDESQGRFSMSREFSAAELCFENFIPLLCVLARRDAITSAGGFDEAFELFEDWELFLRMAPQVAFSHVAEVTARYVQWSATEQVAFAGGPDAREAYLRVIAKHRDRITPETVHAFIATVHEERRSLHRRTRELDTEASELARRHERELAQRDRALAVAREQAADEAAQLRTRLGEATRTLQSIAGSRAWRLLTLYRAFVKERLLPAGTRRRKAYDRLLRTGDSRPSAGAAAGVPLQRALAWQVVREHFLPPATIGDADEELPVKVSVIIPTLNAGKEWRVVLERIGAQQGVREIEVIAVDSGSTDGTLALCAQHGVKVVRYPDEPFNHGTARNVGADAATGELLVFMSQDAIPVGAKAIAGLARPLHADPQVAAASARQVPRSDADLFTNWQLWCFHSKVLSYRTDTTVSVEPSRLATLAPSERRRVAQIDNVFACVRRDAFVSLRFRPLAIAEDLDLGLRLLEHGYRIGFIPSVAAVHSHSRPPAYHMRRSFMETRVLADLLDQPRLDWQTSPIGSVEDAVRAAIGLYRRVGAAVAADGNGAETRPDQAIAAVRACLARPAKQSATAQDESLEATFRQVAESAGLAGVTGDPDHLGPFLRVYVDMLTSFAEYLGCLDVLAGRRDDFQLSLFKLCAETVGHALADFGLWAEKDGQRSAGLDAVAAVLSRGV